MKNVDITVLMTVYNGGDYLKYSVESILNQTHKEFEFLIINDCSTDSSVEIIEAYQDERIVINTNEKNMGQTKSLNKGLRLAKGRYIARIDADDIAFPGWLETQLAFIDQSAEYAVVSAKTAAIDGKNQIKRVLNTPQTFPEIILKSFIASPINHVGSLINKNIALEHGGYDEQYIIAADYDLWSKLIRAGHKLFVTEKVMTAIRFHEESISILERGKRDIIEISDIMRKNINALTAVNISEEEVQLLWKLTYSVDILDTEQFNRAIEILDNVYRNLNPSLGIDPELVKTIKQGLYRTIYVKKIFVLIKSNDITGVRFLCRDYMKKRGGGLLFRILWAASLCGGIFLRTVPGIYETGVRFKTSLKVRNKLETARRVPTE